MGTRMQGTDANAVSRIRLAIQMVGVKRPTGPNGQMSIVRARAQSPRQTPLFLPPTLKSQKSARARLRIRIAILAISGAMKALLQTVIPRPVEGNATPTTKPAHLLQPHPVATGPRLPTSKLAVQPISP
jgi:hypothetical protein